MKKNLFEIKSEEIQRILSLHESRTKSQYLTEAALTSLTLSEPITIESVGGNDNKGGDDLKLFKGTTFTVQDAGNLISQVVEYQIVGYITGYQKYGSGTGQIRYNCSTKRFKVKDKDMSFSMADSFNTPLIEQFNGVCAYAATNPNPQSNTPNTSSKTQFDIQYNHSFGNGAFKIPAKSVAKKYNNDYVVITTPDNKKIWFHCPSKKFSNGSSDYVPEDKNATGLSTNLLSATYLCNKPQSSEPPSPSTTQLTDDQKLDRALLCGYSSWQEYEDNNWACATQLDTVTIKPKKTQQVNKQKQFTQNTVAAINNVQKALGVPEPNGQLKNSDIDNIISKLQ